MMYEINRVDQKDPGLDRRWFFDEEMDLLVWLDGEHIHGFQLCYDKLGDQRALTWFIDSGFQHNRVHERDEKIGVFRGAALLVRDGVLDTHRVAARFKDLSADIDAGISRFVYEKILQVGQ